MEDKSDQNNLMARFLFGELSEEERRQVEERFFIDDEYFDRLQSFEGSLIDDYVRGALPEYSKEEVEKFLSMSEPRLLEVSFVKRLASDISDVEGGTNDARPERGRSRRSYQTAGRLSNFGGPLALASFIILVVISASLLVWNLKVQNRVRQIEMERANLEQELQQRLQEQKDADEDFSKQLAEQRDRLNELGQELNRVQNPSAVSPPLVASLLLSTVPIPRGRGEPPQTRLRPGVQRMKIEVEIPATAKGSSYDVVIKTSDGREVWSKAGLQPDRSGAGVITLSPPAKIFDGGTYILTLKVNRDGGEAVQVHDYAFRIKR